VTFRVVLLFLCFAAAHAALVHCEGETSGPVLLDCDHPPEVLCAPQCAPEYLFLTQKID
jgi:hypothetical protein